MVHTEKAYIRHYKRNDKKNNRIIKSIEVRGLKKNTKFKDKENIIILSENDFNNLTNQLKELQDINKKLTSELNNIDNNYETNQLYIKLFDLMEIINNRNELLFNANDNINYMLDNVIKELEKEYTNLIKENNNEIKERLETFISSLIDKANDHQDKQNNLIASEINNIENDITEANKQLNNMSIFEFIRKRKQINIKLDFNKLKEISKDKINYNELNINVASEKLLSDPNFNNVNHVKIKEYSKNNINFSNLYIKLEHEKNF